MSTEKSSAAKTAVSKIEEILNRLDQAPGSTAPVDRQARRWNYRRSNVPATIEHPAGGATKLTTQTRLLWADGMAVICSAFIYTGSTFRSTLTSNGTDSVAMTGTVVGCRHIDGVYHEVEIKFKQRIDPHLFIDPAKTTGADGSTPVDLPNLNGKILYLDDSESDARLLKHYLRGSAIELTSVKTAAEALTALKTAVYDIFLCDINLGGGSDGVPVVTAARADGFAGPIVILTAETNNTKLAQMKTAGAEHLLPKPYQRNTLIQLMVKMHQQVGAITDGEILYSTLPEEPETDDLLSSYVDSVKVIADGLVKGMVSKDMTTVRELCLNLRGSAAGYGFVSLGTCAGDAVRAIDSTMSVDESRPQLRRLALMCGQLGLRRTAPAGDAAKAA